MNELVTVFIPVYNCEKYIGEALESIINQTYRNIEILIVDDASTDKTVEIINSYKDSRIRLIKNKYNKGIPYNRNIGLKEAKGKYLAIMDADDIAHKYRIEKQVKYFEENVEVDVVASYFTRFGKKIKRLVKGPKTNEEIKAQLIFSSPIANPSAMIKMSTIKENLISYNLECIVAQDYDMWVQISKVGNFHIIPESLLNYRVGHENITSKTKKNKISIRRKIIDKIHEDMLSFYKFDLNNHELYLFNELFDDNPKLSIDMDIIDEYIILIGKLMNQNKFIDKDIFDKVLKENLKDRVYAREVSLIERSKLYLKINKKEPIINKIKCILRFICRDIYRFIND